MKKGSGKLWGGEGEENRGKVLASFSPPPLLPVGSWEN